MVLRNKTLDVLKFPAFLTRRDINLNLVLHRWCQPTVHNYSTRSIVSLDPAKLRSKGQKIHDISHRKSFWVRLWTPGGASRTKFRYQATKDDRQITQDIPFPAHSRGFFYYHSDPQLPHISGGIRFRLCDSLRSFKKGQDLQTITGNPWDISLLRIANIDRFKGLIGFLTEEGLVKPNVIQDLRELEPPTRFSGLYLYHLSQPLVIDFETTAFTVHLVTRKTYSSTILPSPFYNTNRAYRPYSGLAKVRFELSTLQEHMNQGPTLVLRILEFLSPVQRVSPLDSGPYIEPVANSLAMRRSFKGAIKPWAYPLAERVEGAKWKEFLAAAPEMKDTALAIP